MAGPTLNRGWTLTGGVVAAVSQVHCDASRDHKWLVNDIFAGGLTLPHSLGVKEGEVPTAISSLGEQQMPSRIPNPELRDLGPMDDACQLGAGQPKSDLTKRVLIELLRRGEPEQAISGSSGSLGQPIGAGREQKGSTLGRRGRCQAPGGLTDPLVSMERPVTCWYPTGS